MRWDLEKFGVEVARALEFGPVLGAGPDGAAGAVRIGSEGPLRSAAYLLLAGDPGKMLQRVSALMRVQGEPFWLLTPTGGQMSADVTAALARHGCVHVALEGLLEVGPDGRLARVGSIEAVRAEFGRRLTEGRGLVKVVERVGQGLEAIAKGTYELRKENEELKGLLAGGYLKFVLAVDAWDFLAFACVMALGNQNAAAKHLKIPHRSFRDRVERWNNRGRDYQRMLRLVEWRKAVGRKIKLRLEESVQSGEPNDRPENPETVGDVLDTISQADGRDYPALLRQILGALQSQNAKNWPSVQGELVELIKEEGA